MYIGQAAHPKLTKSKTRNEHPQLATVAQGSTSGPADLQKHKETYIELEQT